MRCGIMKKGRIHLSIAIGIALIVFLFTAFVGVAFSYFRSMEEQLYEERRKNLNEISEQIANTINSVCEYSWDVSDSAFAHINSAKNKDDLTTSCGSGKRDYETSVQLCRNRFGSAVLSFKRYRRIIRERFASEKRRRRPSGCSFYC